MSRRWNSPPSSESAFSVVEALVALAVFAMAGVALVELQAHSLSTLARVETRALASVIAQNKLVDVHAAAQAPDLGASAGETAMAGRNWRWRTVVAATTDPTTRRITVDVTGANGSAPAARAHAFISVSGSVR
jgi:general secretion pathway protein I